jgi:hypothetical protein
LNSEAAQIRAATIGRFLYDSPAVECLLSEAAVVDVVRRIASTRGSPLRFMHLALESRIAPPSRARTSLLDKFDDVCARVVARPLWLLAVAAVLLAAQWSTLWYPTPDSAAYLSIARSFWTPEGPTAFGSKHLFFSLGYPLLIAPTFLIEARPFLWIGIVHWLVSLALVAGIYRWMRPLGAAPALFASLFTVLHVHYWLLYRRPLSEPTFMTLFLWAAIVLDRARTTVAIRGRIGWAAAGTVLLVAATLTRPNGVLMAPGFAAAMLATAWYDRTRLRSAMVLSAVVGGIVVGAFFASRAYDDRRAANSQAVTYWDYLVKLQNPEKSMLGRLPDGVLFQMCDFSRLAIPGAFKVRSNDPSTLGKWFSVNTLFAVACTAVVAIGWSRLAERRGDVYTWTFPFYLAMNIVWAADAGTRYTAPLLPIVAATLWFGVAQWSPRALRLWPLLLLLHVGVSVGFWRKDLGRTQEINRQWDAVTTLSASIARDREPLAAVGLTPEQTQLFRFVLDRDVRPLEAWSQAGLRPTWVVTAEAEANLTAEWTFTQSAGPYRLYAADAAKKSP